MTTKVKERTAGGTLPNHRVLTYAFGDIANNLMFSMTSMFIMVYMTDIVGISAAVVGTIYGMTKIWAGAADLIAGQTVDRFQTKWGRLRPWMLFGSTPLAIVFVLLFSTPAGLTGAAAIAWIFLLDALFQLAYSFVNIPYGSLSASMTQDPVDRSRLSGARSITSSLASVLLSAVVAPQFADTAADNMRLKFTITCLILGVIAVCLYLICFANSREVVPRPEGKISFKSTFTMIGHNRPLIILCAATFFLLCGMFTNNTVAMYFTRDVLGNASWFTWLMLAHAGSNSRIYPRCNADSFHHCTHWQTQWFHDGRLLCHCWLPADIYHPNRSAHASCIHVVPPGHRHWLHQCADLLHGSRHRGLW